MQSLVLQLLHADAEVLCTNHAKHTAVLEQLAAAVRKG